MSNGLALDSDWGGSYRMPVMKPRRRASTRKIQRPTADAAVSTGHITELAAYYTAVVADILPNRASAEEAVVMSEAELREILYRYARRGVQFVATGMFTVSALAGLGYLPGWDALAYGLGGFIMMGWSFLLTPHSPLGRLFSGRRLPA